jgi:hypothetical protein
LIGVHGLTHLYFLPGFVFIALFQPIHLILLKSIFFNHINLLFNFSALQPIFQQNNVKLIGVGLEEVGVQEFIDGKFFDGGLIS